VEVVVIAEVVAAAEVVIISNVNYFKN
jgi:hypothetical protein